MENDRNENWVRELIKPKLALSSTENWHAEGARETGGRTASSGSMTDSLKFFFFFFYILLIYFVCGRCKHVLVHTGGQGTALGTHSFLPPCSLLSG